MQYCVDFIEKEEFSVTAGMSTLLTINRIYLYKVLTKKIVLFKCSSRYIYCNYFSLEVHGRYLLHVWFELTFCYFEQDFICVAIQRDQSEVGYIDCEIQPKKRYGFLLFSIVLRTLQLLITLEPLVQFMWGFQQNVPIQMSTSVKLKPENVTWLTSD